jgi:hypothetical protein
MKEMKTGEKQNRVDEVGKRDTQTQRTKKKPRLTKRKPHFPLQPLFETGPPLNILRVTLKMSAETHSISLRKTSDLDPQISSPGGGQDFSLLHIVQTDSGSH